MDVYRSRHKPRPGAVSRHVRISLTPEEWALYEEEARKAEEGMAYTLTRLLASLAETRQQMKRNRAAELFALDKSRNGDDSWEIPE